jgi:hypothetical protein
MTEQEKIRQERRRLKAEYGEVYDAVSALLFREDPMGINFEFNTDEYESEVGTILPRLASCRSAADVTRVVYEEFSLWFGEPRELSQYEHIGDEIWTIWQNRPGPNSSDVFSGSDA